MFCPKIAFVNHIIYTILYNYYRPCVGYSGVRMSDTEFLNLGVNSLDSNLDDLYWRGLYHDVVAQRCYKKTI